MIPVQDLDDPRVAAYAGIRERDLTGRFGRFVAEGEVVLRVLLSPSRHGIESVLLSERRAGALRGLIARVPAGVPVFVAPQASMDGLVGFPIHRGVLAIGRRAPEPSPDELLGGLPSPALVVVLIGIANHDNLGGIFRNAAAFGAGAVLLDATSCDPLYRKAIRVSVGASLLVPFARGEAAALLDACARHGFATVALTPQGAIPLATAASSGRVALLLGAEGPGLPAEVLARAETRVRIPIAENFDSLNVATASGIALDHFARLHAEAER